MTAVHEEQRVFPAQIRKQLHSNVNPVITAAVGEHITCDDNNIRGEPVNSCEQCRVIPAERSTVQVGNVNERDFVPDSLIFDCQPCCLQSEVAPPP
jgi:hypothetical protein